MEKKLQPTSPNPKNAHPLLQGVQKATAKN